MDGNELNMEGVELMWFKVVLTCIFAMESMWSIAKAGGAEIKAKPVPPGGHIFTAIFYGLVICGIWVVLP